MRHSPSFGPTRRLEVSEILITGYAIAYLIDTVTGGVEITDQDMSSVQLGADERERDLPVHLTQCRILWNCDMCG